MYKCKVCNNEFNTLSGLAGHSRIHYKVKITKICPKCNKEFTIIRSINVNGIEKISKKEKKFCSRICANSHVQSIESNKKRSDKLTKIKEILNCKICGNIITTKNKIYCKNCVRKSPEHKEKMSKSHKGITGGYREKGGKCKQGWYKGYFCNSSWELAFVIFNIDHNIKFSRNKLGFPYLYNNEIHKYYPDFILEEGSYIEIKGRMLDKDLEKIKQFPLSLEVIDKDKIWKYLDYVIDKYGKDFIKMYDIDS